MDHKEIRFRILHCLYLKYYSDQLGHIQPTQSIVAESGLEKIDKNEVNGNLIYLSERGYIKGEYFLGSVEPAAIIITSYGIDYIEQTMNNLLEAINKGHISIKYTKELKDSLDLSSPTVKTKKLIEYLQNDEPSWNNVVELIKKQY